MGAPLHLVLEACPTVSLKQALGHVQAKGPHCPLPRHPSITLRGPATRQGWPRGHKRPWSVVVWPIPKPRLALESAPEVPHCARLWRPGSCYAAPSPTGGAWRAGLGSVDPGRGWQGL